MEYKFQLEFKLRQGPLSALSTHIDYWQSQLFRGTTVLEGNILGPAQRFVQNNRGQSYTNGLTIEVQFCQSAYIDVLS